MRIFLSYKFTGCTLEELHDRIDPIRDMIQEMGHEFFCNLYSDPMYLDQKYTPKRIMEHALINLKQSDVFIALNYGIVGEGMGVEFGYAHNMSMPILVLLLKQTKSISFRALCDLVIEFDNIEEIKKPINEFLLDITHQQKSC
jgi:hypothetical protein